MSRFSLRARLVLGVLALSTVGLLVTDVVTYTSLRSFLIDRTDAALAADAKGAQPLLGGYRQPGGGPGPSFGGGGNGQDYVEVRASTGTILQGPYLPRAFLGEKAAPSPVIPSRISLPASPNLGPDRAAYLTVQAVSGGGSWRVLASAGPGSANVLILASWLGPVNATLHRLIAIELIASAAVLAGVAALGLWTVRLGLRPLAEIGATADLITAGDLGRRVERAEGRTEVGRLGLALNTMLDRIEASDSRLRRFVADASHELRTPLTAVRAYSELFERGAASRPDDLARAMSGITRESERMSELVDDLLLLARLDEGAPLSCERVDLSEVAGEAVETAQAVDPARRLELEAVPLVVVGDRTRLRQVIDNLLANVRAHTPAGTPATVRVRREGDDAVVDVSDEGPGLSSEEAGRVFERFHRTDTHRSRESGGAGLGLSIVAAIAEAHAGSASVSSQPGKGATFSVRLPLAERART